MQIETQIPSFSTHQVDNPRREWTPVQYGTLQAALELAQAGFRIFPCNHRTKAPLLRANGEGGWKEQASCDVRRIRHWWHKFPNAMIGLPTGTNINGFVLDLDAGVNAKTGEVVNLKELRSQLETMICGPLPQTWTVNTPRGGQHVYFAMPAGLLLGNSPGSLPKHIDVRGEGGYVIAAGSVRNDGGCYSWELSPDCLALAPAPATLIKLLT
jgi:putative DNA primase/helicase